MNFYGFCNYWSRTDGTDNYEILDGQQRTVSICQFINGDFSDPSSETTRYFSNLKSTEQQVILNYELYVYVCSGTDKEKLDWFKTINIAGERLSDQELNNAIYAGPWLKEAKKYFSGRTPAAADAAKLYTNTNALRQELLETAIAWVSDNDITGYMAKNQFETNASEIWLHFKRVTDWVSVTFPHYRSEMKHVNWGALYRKHGNSKLDPDKLEERVAALMMDDDVTMKSGIYPYVLNDNQKWLNIRSFTPAMKREAYERQRGICPRCPPGSPAYKIDDMEADHIDPWSKGGKTNAANCQMLCKKCNRRKSGT